MYNYNNTINSSTVFLLYARIQTRVSTDILRCVHTRALSVLFFRIQFGRIQYTTTYYASIDLSFIRSSKNTVAARCSG